MESAEQIAARFDARAEHYDDSAMHRALAAAVAAKIRADAGDILDVACGTALVLRSIRGVDESRLTGVDLSPGMLAQAAAALPHARLMVADAHRLPFDDRSFDAISCVTALHLMSDPAEVASEWLRLLRPGGRVLLATFAVPDAAAGQRAGKHVGHGSSPLEEHIPFGTRGALERFASASGFTLENVDEFAFPTEGETEDVCLISELSPAAR